EFFAIDVIHPARGSRRQCERLRPIGAGGRHGCRGPNCEEASREHESNEPGHLSLPPFIKARAACSAQSQVSRNDIASPHRLPGGSRPRQIWPATYRSNQEIATSEMGLNGQFCTAELFDIVNRKTRPPGCDAHRGADAFAV